jgi:hypothetical protein
MPVINVDAQVHECDRPREFFEESDRQNKPMMVSDLPLALETTG